MFAIVLFADCASSQVPQYTLEAKNGQVLNSNTFRFDLVFTHTDSAPLEIAGWQFFFLVPQSFGTLNAGFGANSSFVYDSVSGDAVSDLPAAYRPRNPNTVIAVNAPGFYELRLAANSLPGCGNGLVLQQGVPVLIGSFKLISATPLNLNHYMTFRDSCELNLSVTRTKINWYDANDCLNKEMTRCANHFVDNGTILPVELTGFTSTVFRNNVTLKWSTARETNNSGFDIERTSAGKSEWTKAGNVSGSGTTNETKYYSFTERVNTGKYSYRLKQTDFNGNFEYFNLSSEIEVGIPDAYRLSQNYPNPFNPATKIDYDLPYDGKVSIMLYDISGREVSVIVNEVKPAGYYTAVFNGADLASGMYFYRINATGNGSSFVSSKKLVLIK